MRLSVISFTARGAALSLEIQKRLEQDMEITVHTGHKALPGSLHQWAGEQFQEQNALLFIGACGIAVRAIAPFVKDKLKDPPVLVMDEAGRFVIPVLSGHFGGANELAETLAEKTGAAAVITTATDVNGLFAVDVFAGKNKLAVCNREGIEKVSSAVLAGEEVTVAIAGICKGKPPQELTLVPYPAKEKVSVIVSPFAEDAGRADLQLCPKAYVLGIGCRRGKPLRELEEAMKRQLKKTGLRREALSALASIDRKKEEKGLLELADKYQLPFLTFSSEELNTVYGDFFSSSFVREQTGVDNVCERSAIAACGKDGILVSKKYAENGITVAIAEQKWSVTFDEA